jgi:hypothetical protein
VQNTTIDPVSVAAGDWARNRGLRNYQFSVLPARGHYHVQDCRFDMNVLSAVALPATPGTGRTATIERVSGGECHVCAEQKQVGAAGLFWIDYERGSVRTGIQWEAHSYVTPTRLRELGTALAGLVERGIPVNRLHLMDPDGYDVEAPEDFPLPVARLGLHD